jgi:hypothetical protein
MFSFLFTYKKIDPNIQKEIIRKMNENTNLIMNDKCYKINNIVFTLLNKNHK